MLKFPSDKLISALNRAATIHIIIYIHAPAVWCRKWYTIIRWLLGWMQGNGELAGMTFKRQTSTDVL